MIVALVGAGTLGVATAATKIASSLGGSGDGGGSPQLQLTADSSQVKSLTVRLGDALLPRTAAHAWRSTELSTSTHSMVGFTWTGRHEPRIRIRSRVRGRWTPWQPVAVMHDEPDRDTPEASPVRGTHLVWIGDSDGIHIQVEGARPADLSLVLLHPGPLRGDTSVSAKGRRTTLARRTTVAMPTVLTRKSWGADESWRDGKPRYNATLQQVHVHHSASGNDYTAAQVPALLRGFYRYHTKSLGWSDIGYNFLVDRFGRIWEGRAGGPARLVRGAHTLGFNATSTGVCVIGNYQTTSPSTAVVKAVASVAAWKLSLYGRDPLGSAAVTSEGSDKFRSGRRVTLPVIDGHRDTNDTACPGSLLYARLPAIRKLTKTLITNAAKPVVIDPVAAPVVVGATNLGQTLKVSPGTYKPADATSSYVWLRDGVPIPGATGTTYTIVAADLGHTLSVRVVSTRTGYPKLTQTVSTAATAKATTTMRIAARAHVRRAVLRVHVYAPGAGARPTGTVVVRLLGRTASAPIVDGIAVVVIERLRPGVGVATATYAGTSAYARSSTTRRIRSMRRKRR